MTTRGQPAQKGHLSSNEPFITKRANDEATKISDKLKRRGLYGAAPKRKQKLQDRHEPSVILDWKPAVKK